MIQPVRSSVNTALRLLGYGWQGEPIEPMPRERQKIRKFANRWKRNSAHGLDGNRPLESAKVELHRLREPGEVVDAEDPVVAVLPHVGEDARVGGVQLGVGAETEDRVALADVDHALGPVQQGAGA